MVEIKNNVFHLKQQPVIYVGGVKMTEGNSNRKFYVNNEKKFEKVYGTNWGEYKLDISLKNNKFTIQ